MAGRLAKPHIEIYTIYKTYPPAAPAVTLAPAIVGPLYRMYSAQAKASWYGQQLLNHTINVNPNENLEDVDGEYTSTHCVLVRSVNDEITLPYVYASFDNVNYSATDRKFVITVSAFPNYVAINDVVRIKSPGWGDWYKIEDVLFDDDTKTLEIILDAESNPPSVDLTGVDIELGLYYPFFDPITATVTFYERKRTSWTVNDGDGTHSSYSAPSLTVTGLSDRPDAYYGDNVTVSVTDDSGENSYNGVVTKLAKSGTTYDITVTLSDGPTGMSGISSVSISFDASTATLNQPSGSLIVNSRIRQKNFTELPIVIDNDGEFYETYGEPTLDNPAAQALQLIRGSYAGVVYLYPVAEDTVAGYSEVLNFLSTERDSYSVVPLTSSKQIIDVVKGYVETANAPTKNFIKVLIANYDIPEYVFIENATPTSASYNNTNKTISGLSFSEPVLAGDVIKVNATNVADLKTPFYLTVESVDPNSGNITVKEAVGVNFDIANADLVRTPSRAKSTLKENIINFAESFGSVHTAVLVGHVYTEDVNGNLIELPMYYAAASYAGMIAGFPPQVHFNLRQIPGVVRSDRLWEIFTDDDLGDMAGAGATLIVQDSKSDTPYIRNSLTTDMTSVLTRNLSITKMVDYVKKVIWEDLNGILTRGYNLVGELENTIYLLMQSRFDGWKRFVVPRYGPLILRGALTSLSLDPANETANVEVTIEFPKPLGVIKLILTVE